MRIREKDWVSSGFPAEDISAGFGNDICFLLGLGFPPRVRRWAGLFLGGGASGHSIRTESRFQLEKGRIFACLERGEGKKLRTRNAGTHPSRTRPASSVPSTKAGRRRPRLAGAEGNAARKSREGRERCRKPSPVASPSARVPVSKSVYRRRRRRGQASGAGFQ